MTMDRTFRVMVTGASGFLGRNITRLLLKRHLEWEIAALDLRPPEADIAKAATQVFQVDIRDELALKDAFATFKPDLVIHTAGYVPHKSARYSTKDTDWQHVKSINYDGTVNVVAATLASGCRKLVYTSSVTVVIDDLEHDYYSMNESVPIGLATLHYGRSKGMAEAFVMSPEHQKKGLQACALRPCTIIGPDDTQVISILHDLIAKGETGFIVGDGMNLSDWMYIDNAAHAHTLAAENLLTTASAAGEVFFISNQEPVYFWDFLAAIWAQFGHTPRYRVHIPVALALLVAAILEWITYLTGKPMTLTTGSVKDGVKAQYASNEKAIRVLGYRPIVGLSEGVRRSCDGYMKRLENPNGKPVDLTSVGLSGTVGNGYALSGDSALDAAAKNGFVT